jgi:hypothetical protein
MKTQPDLPDDAVPFLQYPFMAICLWPWTDLAEAELAELPPAVTFFGVN